MSDQQQQAASAGRAFREGFVEADGFRIRYCEAGQGAPLVHLHGAGGLRLNAAHDLLATRYRVIAIEMPGFGQSAENIRTRTMPELAATIVKAADALGLDRFDLMGTSFGGKAALWCLCMVSLSTILAFFAGRQSTAWYRAEMMLRGAAV